MRDGIDPSYYQTLLPRWVCRDRLFARETHTFPRPSFGRVPAEFASSLAASPRRPPLFVGHRCLWVNQVVLNLAQTLAIVSRLSAHPQFDTENP